MAHEISTFANRVFVTGQHPYLDEAATRLNGKWYRKDGQYNFPATAEAELRDIVARIQAGYAERAANPLPPRTAVATPAPAAAPAGWSKASGRRTGRSHPLGEVTYAGDGFTEYEDTSFGGGRVQIWDES